MKQTKQSYLGNLFSSFDSLRQGLQITFMHILRSAKKRKILPVSHGEYFLHTQGISTIQYPHEMIAVPDNGRYRLHNEIDDCIVCDKCAKICPVDCIEIEPVRAVEEIGKTSDGTPKRIYAARFDIDMAKCCFCGLCTTVCPTECLTMTKVFDFSVSDIQDHTFSFAEMSEAEIKEKKDIFEAHQKTKAPAPSAPAAQDPGPISATPPPKPVFRPKIKPPGSTPPAT
jgi:formate hydrogenlyase subunit 6/NADH:ubiquinone oxidoreductase subunit I